MPSIPHDRPYPLGYDITRSAAIDHDAAVGLLGSEGTISLAKPLVKVHRLCLKSIRSTRPATRLGTGQADLRGNIKDERKLGNRGPHGYPLQAADQPLIDVAQRALVDAR
jgi:hypothetical protein